MKYDRRTFLRAIGAGSIGATATGLISGSAAAATVITMEGVGADIWNEQDEFHYYYQQVSGDFDVVVHNLFIENTAGWAKCGLMVRESLASDAKNVLTRRTPGEDMSAQWRAKKGSGSDHTNSARWVKADWMRLKRKGDTVTVLGASGEPTVESDWTNLGTFDGSDLPHIGFSDEVHVGLALTSHNEGTLCTARYKDLSGDISLSEMQNRDIGAVEVAGSVSTEEGVPFVSTGEATDVTATSATLNGTIDDLGQSDSAEAYFQYRAAGADSWSTSNKQTLSSTGSFSQSVSGLSRGTQDYEFRAVADTSDGDSATGSIGRFTTTSIVSIDSIENVGPTSATFGGSLNFVDSQTAEVYFEYRKVPRAEWTTTDAETLTSSGSFGRDVSELTSRRYYQVRAVAETGDGAILVSPVDLFSTPNPSKSNASPSGPESTSRFEPGDGFAEAAPWLDDNTPVVKITEPTRAMVERSDVAGERLLVFETSGTIDLDGDLSISNDRMYLAGQTAPSPGITFIRGGFYIDGNDCVVQHIRARAGDAGKEEGSGWAPDSLHTGDDSKNNIVDHCTATWGVDETLSVGYRTENTTVSNCLIAESILHPSSIDDTRGKGTLVGDRAAKVALLGNVWTESWARNPRLKIGTTSTVVNNVVNYFEEALGYGETSTSSAVGNAFLRSESTENPAIESGRVYLEDNYAKPEVDPLADVREELSSPPLWPEGLKAMSSENVLDHNLANVGARPADRTPHDERVIQRIKDGKAGWIDSQKQVGGYPDLEVNSRERDVPTGGTHAWIRQWARRVETPQP